MLTLGDEIEYIWSSPLSVTNILFFLTRYAPFVDTIIVVWRKFISTFPAFDCADTFLPELVKPDVDADNCAFVYQTIGCTWFDLFLFGQGHAKPDSRDSRAAATRHHGRRA